jgi:Lrp/AsnC ligand binding domain
MVAAVAGMSMVPRAAAARAQSPPEPTLVGAAGDNWLDDAADVGQAVGLIALVLLLLQIRRATRDVRDQRAVSYQERFGDREFRSLTSRALAFLDADDAGECVRKLRAWATSRWADEECLLRSPPLNHARPAINDIQQTLGFFESVGTVFNRGDLTKDVIVNSFATVPVQLFTLGWWFICFRRDGKLFEETETFAEYEELVRYIREKRPAVDDAWQPKAKIRVLCIPSAFRDAPPSAWARCEALSSVLSDRIVAASGDDIARFDRALTALSRAIDDLTARGPTGELKLTLIGIPSDLDMTAQRWNPTRCRLTDAARRLSGIGADGVDEVIRQLGGKPTAAAAAPPARGLTAIIDLRLGGAGKRAAFDAVVADLDQVEHAAHLSGRFDYQVRATCADTAEIAGLVQHLETELDPIETETRVVIEP